MEWIASNGWVNSAILVRIQHSSCGTLDSGVKDIVDDVDCAGDRHAWVVTTSGVVVYADGSG